jgi:hypothetical protein
VREGETGAKVRRDTRREGGIKLGESISRLMQELCTAIAWLCRLGTLMRGLCTLVHQPDQRKTQAVDTEQLKKLLNPSTSIGAPWFCAHLPFSGASAAILQCQPGAGPFPARDWPQLGSPGYWDCN